MNKTTLKNGLAHLASSKALLMNLSISLVLFFCCRVIFYLLNRSYFLDLTFSDLLLIGKGGLVFDLSGLIYVNSLYILMMIIPIHYKESSIYQQIAKGVFVFFNTLALLLNLMDSVYFQFTNRRTTASIFKEFAEEHNLMSIFGRELITHWYLLVVAAMLVFALYKAYRMPKIAQRPIRFVSYYGLQILFFVIIVPCCIAAIRGGFGHAVRPITISNANQYVKRPLESALVLNTPFCIIRTLGQKVYQVPHYFSPEELAAIYTPIHQPIDDTPFEPKNVVVLIMESFGKEYIGSLNRDLDQGTYQGYTPFLDSLITQSVTFSRSYCNGRKSIDAMPSILSSIPMFIEPYFLTHYSMNTISGLAGELKQKGYHSSFFHGAPNGSMGFEAFAKTSGFEHSFGMDEYNNNADFDGTWAIWDEEFFQYYATQLSTFPQPFVSAIFSASSHHPFKVPAKYEGKFAQGPLPIHQCIRYSDYALRRFFEKASKEPWFNKTVFVITADHTNATDRPEFLTDAGIYEVPIIFYEPTGQIRTAFSTDSHSEKQNLPLLPNRLAQQIDIMPTLLNYLHYEKPFFAYGQNLLDDSQIGYVVNYNNQIYQYFQGTLMLQFDGEKSTALFDVVQDRLLKHNILASTDVSQMERKLKAIIQQYVDRMVTDRMVVDK